MIDVQSTQVDFDTSVQDVSRVVVAVLSHTGRDSLVYVTRVFRDSLGRSMATTTLTFDTFEEADAVRCASWFYAAVHCAQ